MGSVPFHDLFGSTGEGEQLFSETAIKLSQIPENHPSGRGADFM
jgi:hypothetical protein